MLPDQYLPRSLRQGVLKLAWLSGIVLLGASATVLSDVPAMAAERVILTYGAIQEPFSIQDMQTFAETGELSRLRQFQLRVAGADPEVLREFLNHKLQVDFLLADRALNSMPGEYLLYQIGQVIHNRQRVAPIQSLRSALVLSAREDNQISMLRFLQNYPLREVYVDGKKLAEIGRKVGNTREKVGRYLDVMAVVIQQVLGGPLCPCDEVGTTDRTRNSNK